MAKPDSRIAVMHKLFSAKTLPEIIGYGRRLLGNPIILTDLTHQVLCMSEEPELLDPKWQEIRRERRVPVNQAITHTYQRALAEQRPILDTDNQHFPILRTVITQGDNLIGFLEIPCYHSIPTQEESDIVTFLADVIFLHLKKELRYMGTPQDILDFFIVELLEGRHIEPAYIQERCDYFHWHMEQDFRVVSICAQDGQNIEQRSQELFLRQLESLLPDATCFVYSDQIKLILPVYQSTAKDGVTFHALIDFLKQNGLEAGISRNTDSLSHLARGNVESVKALEMGQLFHSQECLFFYDKFSVYHALDLCQKNYDVMNFCHSALFILATYDRTHGTSLLDTLHAFLFCHHSLTEAAAKLFIHRNTMNNRMEKIVELTGVDLQDAEAAFHLMFSFHILEYYGATVALDYEQHMRHNPTLRHQ